MVRRATIQQYAADHAERPAVDSREPATIVPAAVAYVLDVAETWLGWDGRAVDADGNRWTPHKALRRIGDHLVDHLAEIESRLAGRPGLPDQSHNRMVTLDCDFCDFARFTEVDLDAATSRLTRLAACYEARLAGLEATQLDARPADNVWTIREVAHHVGGVAYYAEAVGRTGGAAR
jgi:hypothetical protein